MHWEYQGGTGTAEGTESMFGGDDSLIKRNLIMSHHPILQLYNTAVRPLHYSS